MQILFAVWWECSRLFTHFICYGFSRTRDQHAIGQLAPPIYDVIKHAGQNRDRAGKVGQLSRPQTSWKTIFAFHRSAIDLPICGGGGAAGGGAWWRQGRGLPDDVIITWPIHPSIAVFSHFGIFQRVNWPFEKMNFVEEIDGYMTALPIFEFLFKIESIRWI